MKIGIVSPFFYPWYGGVTEQVGYLYRHLKKRGHDVRVITPFDGREVLDDPADLIKTGRTVPFPANGSIAPVPLLLGGSGRAAAIMELEQFDVLHLHQPLFNLLCLSFLKAVRQARRSGKRTPRVFGTFHASGGRIERFAVRVSAWYLRRFIPFIDEPIAVSEAARAFVAPIVNDGIRIIPNGIDIRRFASDGRSTSEHPTHSTDDVIDLLYVGRLEPRKKVSILLESLAFIPRFTSRKFRLTLVGNGPGTSCYRRRIPVEMRDRVRFAGKVGADELPAFYRRATIFCSPAAYGESFGIVLIEAMAAGVAIVAGRNEGYQRLLRDHENALLVNPIDPLVLAKSLAEVIDSEPLRRRLVEQGYATAKRFDNSLLISEMEQLYTRGTPGRSYPGPAKEVVEKNKPERIPVLS